jgi:hypothetical protein
MQPFIPLYDYAAIGFTPRMRAEAVVSLQYELDHYRSLYLQNEIGRTEWRRHETELTEMIESNTDQP